MSVPAVLTDADVRARLTAAGAVAAMRDALVAHHEGRLTSPPRVAADLGGGRLIFTTGALAGEWYGYRSYDSFPVEPGAQVVVVHDACDGLVRAVAVGNELGPRRVGAIGGVAADVLARPDATTLGLVGTGTQAYTQLWAIAAVRPLTDVTVYGRDPGRRERFVSRVRDELGLPVRAVDSAEAAVRERDVVVLATSSHTPVLDPAWVAPGAYVTTLGPKQRDRTEFGPELAERAGVLVTDSVAQVHAYDPLYVLAGTPHADRLTALGAVVAGAAPGRTAPDQVVLFLSVGLAGTEAYLLAHLAASG